MKHLGGFCPSTQVTVLWAATGKCRWQEPSGTAAVSPENSEQHREVRGPAGQAPSAPGSGCGCHCSLIPERDSGPRELGLGVGASHPCDSARHRCLEAVHWLLRERARGVGAGGGEGEKSKRGGVCIQESSRGPSGKAGVLKTKTQNSRGWRLLTSAKGKEQRKAFN